MRLETLTPELTAVPGTTVSCHLQVVNESSGPSALSLRVFGLGPDDARPVPGDPIPAGHSQELVVPLRIPDTFADGHHALAIEVRSDRPDEGVVLATVNLKVASLDRVILRIVPSVLRGQRREPFDVEVDNRRDEAVELTLSGEGQDLFVKLDRTRVRVDAHEQVRIGARVRGPSNLVGDELQHVITVIGRGAAAPTYATAAFNQRPTFARGLRGLMAGLAILALWAGIVGGGAYWWSQRGKNDKSTAGATTATTVGIDANGNLPALSTVPGDAATATTTLGGAPGATVAGGAPAPTVAGGVAASGNGAPAGGTAAPGAVDSATAAKKKAPTETLVRGSVKAGKTGANSDVIITLTPLVGGQPPSNTVANPTVQAGGGGAGLRLLPPTYQPTNVVGDGGVTDDQTKFWSARSGRYTGGDRFDGTVATLTVQSTNSQVDGTFKFPPIPLRRSYEVNFAKAGFDTQSIQVNPTDDGKPIELKVQLLPSKGALGGKITGPDGKGLGGVKLSITDGTLTFATASSTDAANKGHWLVDGISTPGTYTVVATLAGYGTEVAKSTLAPKTQDLNINLQMSNGVGSVAGTIRGPKGPLGGVTLTASDGTTTRTTSSFTGGGTTGGYIFPRLPVPGTYTISATAPGYSTKTQTVTITAKGPNATGIDFDMVSTFASVTGLVMSVDPTGARAPIPLENASIELTLGQLPKVRSTSAISDPGTFTLTNLPPGDYTIAFGRYDHSTVSMPITLAAGQLLDLKQILLTYTPRQQLDPQGSLSLVINKVVNTAPVPLDQVTLTLTDIAGRNAVTNPPIASVNGSYKYSLLPIGTYKLLVERTGYRPFQVARISIGLTDVPLTVTMLKFGSAFGQVVETLPTVAPLNDYELLLYQKTGPILTCKGLLTVGPNVPVDPQGKIRWSVGLDLQLLSGDYVVRFRPAPGDGGSVCSSGGRLRKGYTDQPDVDGNVGSFSVSANNDDPVEVPDIPLYAYPSVRGLVLAPRFAAGAVTFVGLDDLIAADLAVTLDCGTVTTALATLTRAGNSASFTFDRIAVSALFGQAPLPPGGVLPVCHVKATAKTFASVDAAMPTALVIPTVLPFQDRVVNIALVDDPDVLLGSTYWKDPANGNPVFIGGVDVKAPGAISAFGAGQTDDPDGPGPLKPTAPNPPGVPTDLATSTATGTGFWSFPGIRQVFGSATYSFTNAKFTSGSFDLIINETGRTVLNTVGLAEPVVDDGNLDIVMVPNAGRIRGNVTVVTTRNPQTSLTDAVINAKPPGAAVVNPTIAANGDFTIDPALAGTWGFEFATTPTGNLVPGVGQAAESRFVDAGGEPSPVNAQYLELAQIVTEFRDGAGAIIAPYTAGAGATPYPRMKVDLVGGPVYPAPTNRNVAGDATGQAAARLLSVSPFLSTSMPIPYHVTFELPGFELNRSTWTVYDEGNQVVASGTGVPDITTTVVAGTRLRVVLGAPKFGSITGTVRGLLRPPSTAAADVEALDIANPDPAQRLTVTVQQVTDASGTQLVPAAPIQTPTPTAGPPPGFTIGLPTGFYLITYSHPDYIATTRVVFVPEGRDVSGSADLNIAQGSFELTVVTDETVTGVPVDGALVQLWPGGTPLGSILTVPPAVAPSYGDTTGKVTPGFIDFDPTMGTGITPGNYVIVVRRSDPLNPSRDANFPVIGTITVPRGSTPELRTVAKKAVMPRTDGSISGTVVALNINNRPVNLPAFTVTRTLDAVAQATGPDALPNTATDADQRRLAQQASRSFTPATSSQNYDFGELVAGGHTLTFSEATTAGFTAPLPIPVVVNGTTTVPAPQAIYRAVGVTVRISLPGLVSATSHPGVGVTMGSLVGGPPLLSTEDPAAPGTWVFDAVPPDLSAYTISITAANYTINNAAELTFVVPPSSTAVLHDVHVTAFSTISGTATKRLSATTTGPVTEAGSVRLERQSDGSAVGAAATPNAGGVYAFTVTTAEPLRVHVVVPGFKDGFVNVPTFTLAQTVAVPEVFVNQLGTFDLTVAGPPSASVNIAATPSTGVTVTPVTPDVFRIGGLDPAVAYTFEVSATGFLSQQYPLVGSFTPTIGQNPPASITLETPKSISGTTLKGAPPGVQSTVTLLQGATVIAGPTRTSATGAYTFIGLTYGTYTVQASEPGVGAGQLANISVAVGVASPINQNVTLAARPLTVQFNVTPATVPTITINGAPGTAGQTTFTFPEDGNKAYTVTSPGFIDVAGTATIPRDWNGVDTVSVPVALTTIGIQVNGTGKGPGNNFPATAYLCPGTVTTAAACATSAQTANIDRPNGGFAFSPVPAGDYQVVAKNGAGGFTPLVAVTVTAAGVVTPSPLIVTFA